jgi:hypothetical protein
MKREIDPKKQILRKIDAHREVLASEIDLLQYQLRPITMMSSVVGWIGKATAFGRAASSRKKRGLLQRKGFDLETLVWVGLPLVKWYFRRRRKKR